MHRLNKKTVELLKSLEERIEDRTYKCAHCAYRDQSVNHCWYTMTTDKPIFKSKDKSCNHYVDIEKLLEKME